MNIALALRDTFYQTLLHDFLERFDYKVVDESQLSYLLSTKNDYLLLTDNRTLVEETDYPAPIIWLVDCTQGSPLVAPLPKLVRGVLCGQSSINELLPCLKLIEQGHIYLSTQLLQHPHQQLSTPLLDLTERERQVYALIANGLTLKAIAERLYLSSKTVENHRANIQRKLGLSGRKVLFRHALLASQFQK